MTIRFELNPETEARLVAEARAKGLSLEKIAEQFLQEALAERSTLRGPLSVEEFHSLLAALAQGSEKLPDLSTDSFSRESFYEDRVDGRDALPR
jgi:hypothetical protein